MNYVMLPSYVSSETNNEIMSWLAPLPGGSWMFDNLPGEPAKLVFLDEELASMFKLTFGDIKW
jgi:hypothetical protein